MSLHFTIERNIAYLVPDAPPSNVMTLGFFEEFRRIIQTLPPYSGIQALIVTGKGRHFSSGARIEELLCNIDKQLMMENYRAFVSLGALDIPVIAAIRGVCLGSAFELGLFCHFRICTPDAVLGLPESTYNLIPGIGGSGKMAELAGKASAIELTLRGSTFTASDAMEMGLADAVVPKEHLTGVAERFALSLPAGFKQMNRKMLIHRYLKSITGHV